MGVRALEEALAQLMPRDESQVYEEKACWKQADTYQDRGVDSRNFRTRCRIACDSARENAQHFSHLPSAGLEATGEVACIVMQFREAKLPREDAERLPQPANRRGPRG